MPGLSEVDRALMRSQSESGAGVAFSTTPCTPLTRLEPPALSRALVASPSSSPSLLPSLWQVWPSP